MRKPSTLLIASVVALFSGLAFSAIALSQSGFANLTGKDTECVLQAFDRESCEQECRSRFGVDPYELQFSGGWGRGGRPGYYVYANCIQECNTRFWKEFDRTMRDLERENLR
jgi:hypothetical protein